MNISNRRESITLFLGDIVILLLSLWASLGIRSGDIPSKGLYMSLLFPFSMIFVISLLIFFIAGLYEKHTVILKSRLPFRIFRTQIINSIMAVVIFYFIPYFGVAPKTILFIYLVVSFLLILFWRSFLFNFFVQRRVENALIVGAGTEMEELIHEINRNGNYGMRFIEVIDLDASTPRDIEDKIVNSFKEQTLSLIVIDLEHDKIKPMLSDLYKMIFFNVRFLAMYKVYEDVFKRIPFFSLQYNWFIENISSSPKLFYDAIKRLVDIILSFFGGVISLIIYPFVWLAIKLDDGGSIFIMQKRIGEGGKIINLIKFRSMVTNDHDKWWEEGDTRMTRVGKYLRILRIDELPQLWNVLAGDLSLIGPRPDIYDLGQKLANEIPYYTIRNIIKPGLSGWALLHQELAPQNVEETKIRLAYDLYYVKNRSLVLDFQIILKTIRTLLSRSGR